MASSTSATRYIPIQPGVELDANGMIRDLSFQFVRMTRQSAVNQWFRRFAYAPETPFPSLLVDMPIDMSVFGFESWTGTPTFQKHDNVKIRLGIAPFWGGVQVDVRALEDPNSNEILAFNQRAQRLFDGWNQFLPPKIYTLLKNGQSDTISGGHPVTGASAFFSTSHYVNVKKTDFGTFSNLVGDGGANASSPIYAVLGGGVFDSMRPWSILKGSNLDRARAAAGRPTGGAGDPWVIEWMAESDSQLMDMGMQAKLGVYAELGWGLLFPHSIIRYEGTLDYPGLKSLADAARGMKDLNGYMPADQTRIVAFLCDTPAQASDINGILDREITDTASTGVRIDPMLRSAEVIIMSR
ncbi:MAG: hypothetical protein EKK62_03140 [Acidimicrobiia bacterium]|nr:MAG: hypothetical protein EKK62_03140 [Acidimicrobiia bacterium]